jgi:putative salt-induced outer membrane protein YdiY
VRELHLQAAHVVTELPVEEKPPETWHGAINVAFESARGNTYKNNASILANLNRRWDEDRVNIDFGYYYSETGTSKDNRETSTHRWEVEGQHDHFWTEKFYSYENGRYERDDIAGIDFRLRLGLGLGYQWLDGYKTGIGKVSFSQELGGAWVRVDYEEKDPSAKDSFATLRYAHHLKYNPKWNEELEAFHNLEFLPQVDDWDNQLIKADVGFTTKIIMDFDLLAKIEWDYNSMPSVGRKSSDVRYIVGLGYKW